MGIYSQPGATFEASLEDAPTGLMGIAGVQIIDTPAGTILLARTTAGIVELPAGSGLYHVTLTAPTVLGTYRVVWDTGGSTPQYAEEELVVSGYAHPTSTFATVADVEAKCGTGHDETTVEYLLDAATALILSVVDKDLDWLADPDTVVPPMLRFVAVEMVCGALNNPHSSTATREQLGEYSYSQSFGDHGGMSLTAAWERALRAAVWGTGVGSARVDSIAFDAEPWT